MTWALLLAFAAQDKKPDGPKPLYTVPLAAAPGAKTKLVLRGLKLDTVTEVKAAVPVKLLSKKKAPGPTNFPVERAGDSECEIEVELPRDFAAAALDLTTAGPGGSGTYKLTIGTSLAEKEPNDGFAAAQGLTLPATVIGTIGRDRDVDVFRFAGKAGEVVRIEVTAARLGSPTDALLTLYDADRRVLAINDDANGSVDPVLSVTLPKDGVYFVSLIDAHDVGGAMFPYRLTVSTGPKKP